MKKFIIPIVCCFAIHVGFAQKATNMSTPKVSPNGTMNFSVMDNAPTLKKCNSAESPSFCTVNEIKSFLIKNISKDAAAVAALKSQKDKKAYIRFVVSKTGSVENIGVRTENTVLKSKLTKILAKLPKFSAGSHNGTTLKAAFGEFINLSEAVIDPTSKTKF
ncbi:hypothetical protein EZY14_002390 [Kordia sp. TARA_039_SRF]|nr:hypothetical protein EZY14_002390 [Kordia sp. TARA_039_SRF]